MFSKDRAERFMSFPCTLTKLELLEYVLGLELDFGLVLYCLLPQTSLLRICQCINAV